MIGDTVALEVKSKSRVSPRDCKGLLALGEEVPLRRKLLVCSEAQRRTTDDGVEVVPIPEFLRDLWEDRLF